MKKPASPKPSPLPAVIRYLSQQQQRLYLAITLYVISLRNQNTILIVRLKLSALCRQLEGRCRMAASLKLLNEFFMRGNAMTGTLLLTVNTKT